MSYRLRLAVSRKNDMDRQWMKRVMDKVGFADPFSARSFQGVRAVLQGVTCEQ
jgi:hypothetical protein